MKNNLGAKPCMYPWPVLIAAAYGGGGTVFSDGNEDKQHMGGKHGSCESCTYYSYDEEYGCYVCDVNMDEDEYIRFISDAHYACPYYRNGDDYRVVRKQM